MTDITGGADGVRHASHRVVEGLTTQKRIIGGDLATLLYVVQLGAISIDPWHSRTQSIQFADYAIIDLDPGPRARFRRVIEVARAVKASIDTVPDRGRDVGDLWAKGMSKPNSLEGVTGRG